MKNHFFFLLLFLLTNSLSAQKVVDRVIDNDDRKKVEQARRLYNQYKIFEGEKILKDLVKKNPKEVYFYEALVQMQRQVLYRIQDATGELQQMNLGKAAQDSVRKEEAEEAEEADEKDQAILDKPVNTKEIFESLGLDMAKINVKEKEVKNEEEEAKEPTDATVTIDSSLIFSDEERNEFRKQSSGSTNKIDKKTQRKLKIIESFAQIPFQQYLYDLIQNARNATRLFINADSSSLYLRKFLSDTINVNEGVSSEAWTEYIKGLEQLYDKVIPSAAKHFENAVALDPTFYEAHIKLGDVYYLMNNDTGSIQQYKYASLAANDKSEPFEKLAMMQYNRGPIYRCCWNHDYSRS
jgi:predicted Zn-dependent protease